MTSGNGHAVVVVVRTHDAENVCFLDRGFEWWQENALHFVQSRLRIGTGLSFTSTLGDAVNGEVLGRRHNLIILLHRLGHLDPKSRYEIRIFAVGVFNSSPTLVARDVQRRRIHVCVTQRARLVSGDAADLADQLLVPRVALA